MQNLEGEVFARARRHAEMKGNGSSMRRLGTSLEIMVSCYQSDGNKKCRLNENVGEKNTNKHHSHMMHQMHLSAGCRGHVSAKPRCETQLVFQDQKLNKAKNNRKSSHIVGISIKVSGRIGGSS